MEPFCAWDVEVVLESTGKRPVLRVYASTKADAEQFAVRACAENGTPAMVGHDTCLHWGDEDRDFLETAMRAFTGH